MGSVPEKEGRREGIGIRVLLDLLGGMKAHRLEVTRLGGIHPEQDVLRSYLLGLGNDAVDCPEVFFSIEIFWKRELAWCEVHG